MTVQKSGVTTDSADRILIDAGAIYINFYDVDSPGTLLGATRGGNVVEINRTIRDLNPDGAKGKVKGFRRIESVEAKITANMMELTAETLKMALAGAVYASGTSTVTNEAVATANGVLTDFALDHGKVEIGSESVTVGGVAKVRGTDYTVDYDNGTLQFYSAPANLAAIVCTYDYVSGDAVINGAEVANTSFLDNVVIVGTITGMTSPVIVKLTNVLCETALSLSLAPKDEAVPQIVFSAHYSYSDLASEPWSITYPAS